MIEVNLLRERGYEYNGQCSFVWHRPGKPWLALIVRKGEAGGIFSRVQRAKGNPQIVYD